MNSDPPYPAKILQLAHCITVLVKGPIGDPGKALQPGIAAEPPDLRTMPPRHFPARLSAACHAEEYEGHPGLLSPARSRWIAISSAVTADLPVSDLTGLFDLATAFVTARTKIDEAFELGYNPGLTDHG
jgi:hypothetical protein